MQSIGLAAATALAVTVALSGQAVADHAAPDGSASAALSLEPQAPRAGQRTALVVSLSDAAGEPLDELVTSHGRKLHAVIVSEDMSVFGHVHPEDFGEAAEDGEARMYFTFPQPGRYIVGTDLVARTGPYAEQFLVEVGGEALARSGIAAAPKVAAVELRHADSYTAPIVLDGIDRAGGYQVSLAGPARVAAGEPVTFTFRIARGGAPVTDLRPYLEAPLHLAVVSDDLGTFLHAHGAVPDEEGHEGHGAAGHGHAHGGHDGHGAASFGPEVTATVTFPEPGRYALFGQAAHGNRLLIARFPVIVE